MLAEFFAVTMSGSLYTVTDEKDENGWPVAKRVINGPLGKTEEFRLKNGKLVGIGDLGVCLFDPTPRYGRAFEHMNIGYWGGCTSGLVALFLERSTAEACIASGDRMPLSPRFENEARATLEAIGDKHPTFVIGDSMGHLMHSNV
jgi:hypothetical protein